MDNCTEEEKEFLRDQCITLYQRAALLHAELGTIIEMIEDENLKQKLREMWKSDKNFIHEE
ncbi:MAG: hypothetical protein IJ385_04250 [Ruminiclostridium sp.]|nr:hypothetical protein [Ruminiclostridium sp.]